MPSELPARRRRYSRDQLCCRQLFQDQASRPALAVSRAAAGERADPNRARAWILGGQAHLALPLPTKADLSLRSGWQTL